MHCRQRRLRHPQGYRRWHRTGPASSRCRPPSDEYDANNLQRAPRLRSPGCGLVCIAKKCVAATAATAGSVCRADATSKSFAECVGGASCTKGDDRAAQVHQHPRWTVRRVATITGPRYLDPKPATSSTAVATPAVQAAPAGSSCRPGTADQLCAASLQLVPRRLDVLKLLVAEQVRPPTDRAAPRPARRSRAWIRRQPLLRLRALSRKRRQQIRAPSRTRATPPGRRSPPPRRSDGRTVAR